MFRGADTGDNNTMQTTIYYQTDKNGRRVAYRYSWSQLRSFRIGLAEAELLLATGQATLSAGHPLKGE